ncbi:MAG: hypothetical protein OEW67_03430 [Cyclobacteriaceae bacterium]|nr:hypothetical protein [Cyclobacteriaceae bacterium]
MNNIDRLFKEKLEFHRTTPSKAVWQKLEGELKKGENNKVLVWVSVAASILLVFIISIAYLKVGSNIDNSIKISKVNQVDNNTSSAKKSANTKPNNQVVNNDSRNTTSSVKEGKIDKKNINTYPDIKNKTTPTIDNTSHTLKVDYKQQKYDQTNDAEVLKNNKAITNLLEANLEDIQTVSESQKDYEISTNSSITIVYNLEPVVKVDTSRKNNEKNRVFGKIVAFAKNAKSSEIGLSQLRAVKDDFLSLDNFNNKQQTQK